MSWSDAQLLCLHDHVHPTSYAGSFRPTSSAILSEPRPSSFSDRAASSAESPGASPSLDSGPGQAQALAVPELYAELASSGFTMNASARAVCSGLCFLQFSVASCLFRFA